MPLNVFVTDGDERPALAIVRALGRSGLSVAVGSEKPACLSSSSKYCARHVVYPSPSRDPDGFERFLTTFIHREEPSVVLPVTDIATHSICALQELMGLRSATAVPPLDAFELVSDKRWLLERAARCGIRVPRTHAVQGLSALAAIENRIAYPAVVKPVRSRIRTRDGWLATGVHYASCRGELRNLFERTEYLATYPSLIQERIEGSGVGMFGLFDRGELIAEFAHVRLREKPPSGGVSVLRVSVAVDPVLREAAIRLLGPLGWHGVAMIEFKQERRTGELVLMEVNGRFWGSLQLAIDAGLDFPRLACDLALGRRPPAMPPYKVGVRNRWLLGDLDHLLLRLFKSAEALHLPAGAPSRWRAAADFLQLSGRDLHYETISRDDPGPFAYECRQYTRAFSESAARSIRHAFRGTSPSRSARPAPDANRDTRSSRVPVSG